MKSLHGPRALRRLAAGGGGAGDRFVARWPPGGGGRRRRDRRRHGDLGRRARRHDRDVRRPGVLGLSIDPETSTVGADGARTILTVMIQNVLSAGLLDSLGVEPLADSDRDEQFQSLVASQPQFGELDDHGQQVVTDNVVQFGQLDEITVDDLGDLESRYEASPASLGVVCAQLFTATDATPPWPPSTRWPTATSSPTSSPGTGCPTTRSSRRPRAPTPWRRPATTRRAMTRRATATRRQPVTRAPMQARRRRRASRPTRRRSRAPRCAASPPSAPTSPRRCSTCPPVRPRSSTPGRAVYVLDIGSYDEVSAPLHDVLSSPPPSASGSPESLGRMLLDGYMATADVSVDPRYGRWDPLSGERRRPRSA